MLMSSSAVAPTGWIGLPGQCPTSCQQSAAIFRVPLGDIKLSQSDTDRRWMFQQLRLRGRAPRRRSRPDELAPRMGFRDVTGSVGEDLLCWALMVERLEGLERR